MRWPPSKKKIARGDFSFLKYFVLTQITLDFHRKKIMSRFDRMQFSKFQPIIISFEDGRLAIKKFPKIFLEKNNDTFISLGFWILMEITFDVK